MCFTTLVFNRSGECTGAGVITAAGVRRTGRDLYGGTSTSHAGKRAELA